MATNELLIVDCAVEDIEFLLAGFSRGIELLQLERGQDPVAQIARALTSRFGTKRLHIACFSETGALSLAGVRVDEAYLDMRASALSTIAFAMSDQPEVVLWTGGINPDADRQDQMFVNTLSDATGARISVASTGIEMGPAGAQGLRAAPRDQS